MIGFGLGIFTFFLSMLIFYMWLEGRKNKITYSELSFSSFPKRKSGMKLFFISDIHHRLISETILEEIRGEVDFIIIGGDLAEKKVPFTKIEKNVKALSVIAPTYFVWGNNDYEVDHLKLEGLLKKENVTLLENEAVLISDSDEPVYLIGVDDYGHHFDDLEKAIENCHVGFQILVSHNPDIKKKIRQKHEINLILSGHTHGGQIRLFGYGVAEKAGVKKLKNELFMLVSNGYGTTRLPLRFGAPAEVHVITIKEDV